MDFKLVKILLDGGTEKSVVFTDTVLESVKTNLKNYERTGYSEPWCAYLAVDQDQVIGTCAFKAPPNSGKVEIAYFTFPTFEGKGHATQMVKNLIEIARIENASIQITAQTLAQESASTHILKKAGFIETRTIIHPQDGKIWEWELKAI